ncbi:hypothetical protein K438DRAFT_1928454, partial [Mycena galopus ATCC 62051]
MRGAGQRWMKKTTPWTGVRCPHGRNVLVDVRVWRAQCLRGASSWSCSCCYYCGPQQRPRPPPCPAHLLRCILPKKTKRTTDPLQERTRQATGASRRLRA